MNATIPFLTTMALGVMVGITGTHFKQVGAMVEQGAPLSNVQSIDVIPVYDHSSKDAVAPPVTLATNDVSAVPAESGRVAASGHGSQHEGALLEILAAMRSEQKNMRLQLAETNRDLAEANFRLDAQSSDFRPLRTDSERPRSMDHSTDPMGGDVGSGDSLLPPKP